MRALGLAVVLALVAPTAANGEGYTFALDLFGVSKHSETESADGARYNESNPGFGFAVAKVENARRIVYQLGSYTDSSTNKAKFAAAHYQVELFPQRLFAGVGIFVGQSEGYYHGAPFIAPLPTLTMALSKALLVNAIYIPHTDRGGGNPETLGIFFSYQLAKM